VCNEIPKPVPNETRDTWPAFGSIPAANIFASTNFAKDATRQKKSSYSRLTSRRYKERDDNEILAAIFSLFTDHAMMSSAEKSRKNAAESFFRYTYIRICIYMFAQIILLPRISCLLSIKAR